MEGDEITSEVQITASTPLLDYTRDQSLKPETIMGICRRDDVCEGKRQSEAAAAA